MSRNTRARPEKAESGGDSQAGRIMIHHTGWEEARMDGKTLFAGFTGTHGTGGSCRTVPARSGAHVRCQRELHDQADAAGRCLAEQEDKVRAFVAETPDLTITELWQKITALGIRVGRSAVARFLLHLQLTFKKKPCMPPSRNARTSRRPAPPGVRCRKALILKGLYLSTRPRPRPTLHPATGAVKEARDFSPGRLPVTGRRQLFWPRCATMA